MGRSTGVTLNTVMSPSPERRFGLLSSSWGNFNGKKQGGKYSIPLALETFISTANYDSSHKVCNASSHGVYLL